MTEHNNRVELERLLDEHFPRIEPRVQRAPNRYGDDPAVDARDDERSAIVDFIDVILDAGFERPVERIIQPLRAEGLGTRAIAARTGLTKSKVHRISQATENQRPVQEAS